MAMNTGLTVIPRWVHSTVHSWRVAICRCKS